MDRDPLLLGERKQSFGSLFGDEREVDVVAGERSLVGATQHQQRFGEIDRPGVHGPQPFDEFGRVAVRIVAGDVEKGLRDRQRGAQLVRGVGRESLLLGVVGFETREHRIETVGQLAELVVAPLEIDSVREGSAAGSSRGVGDPRERGEHRAGEKPPADQAESEQEDECPGCRGHESTQKVVAVGERWTFETRRVGRNVAQQEHVDDGQQERSGHHEERHVAEREFQAHAHAGCPGHRSPPLCGGASMR